MSTKESTKQSSFTPYNIGSVLLKLFSTAEAVQYCEVLNGLHSTDAFPPVLMLSLYTTEHLPQYCCYPSQY